MALELINISDNFVRNIVDEKQDTNMRRLQYPELLSRLCPSINTNISVVTNNLILTSASNVNSQTLETCDISCIISCAPELPEPQHKDEVIYFRIDIKDSGCCRILPYFDKSADLIQQVSNLGGKTLIYCVAGVSRSASICIAYLMKHHRLSLLESYNYIKNRRTRIKPNCGFFKQLIEYEKHLFGYNTVKMVFNEVVHMEIPEVYDKDYKQITNLNKKKK